MDTGVGRGATGLGRGALGVGVSAEGSSTVGVVGSLVGASGAAVAGAGSLAVGCVVGSVSTEVSSDPPKHHERADRCQERDRAERKCPRQPRSFRCWVGTARR